MGPDAMILDFWMLNFKPTSSLSSFTFLKRLFAFCHKGDVPIQELVHILQGTSDEEELLGMEFTAYWLSGPMWDISCK